MELISVNTIYRMKNGTQQEIKPGVRFTATNAAEGKYLMEQGAAKKYVAPAAPESIDTDVDADGDTDTDVDVDTDDDDGDAADDLV